MGEYVVERATEVEAPVERVHALVSELRQWEAWSPWADLDPEMRREYSGPAAGVGARSSWVGNRRAGQGEMQVSGDRPDRVDVDLRFEKPFRSESTVAFLLVPTDRGTEVTWRMTGEQRGLQAVLGKIVPMDRLIGKDFEKGLARLKDVAERGS